MDELPSNDEWPDGWRYSQKRGDYFVLTYDLHEHHVIETGGGEWTVDYNYNGRPNGRMAARTASQNGFERLKRDCYNNFLSPDDRPYDLRDVFTQMLPTYATVVVECVPETDLHPASGDRRVSNYLELPDHEFIVREYGNGWERLDVRTVESVEEGETRVRTMELPNEGPIPEVETIAPMELDHFIPNTDTDESRSDE